MSNQYKVDYIWMRRRGGEPVRVSTDPDELNKALVAGYAQCEPPAAAKTVKNEEEV